MDPISSQYLNIKSVQPASQALHPCLKKKEERKKRKNTPIEERLKNSNIKSKVKLQRSKQWGKTDFIKHKIKYKIYNNK